MRLLSFDNPVFAAYANAAGLMVLKAVAMSWLTVARMMWLQSGFRSPEDLRRTVLNPRPRPDQLLPDERVERIRRIQHNDLENLPFFFVAGALYVLTSPPLALAQWCDFLVVATPGGGGTRHLVNEAVLEAIGPQGALVNIARGSVVDTQALARVLREHRLGAAGIDVYESEPHRPEELIDLPNIVLTPHVAGRSPEAVQATITRFLANMEAYFAGRPVLSPV